MTLLDFARAKRRLNRWMAPRGAPVRRLGFTGNVHLRVQDRETGEETRRESQKNSITNIALFVDLIQGTSSDHLSSASNLRIKDSGGSTVKLIGSTASGPAAASGAQITMSFEDLSSDTYNPDDIELESSGSVKVAEVLNVAWSDKASSENWFVDWDISLSGGVTAGMNGMLDCITGVSSQHWDGTEASNNTQIQVYDGNPGSLEFSQAATAAVTQPTSTSLLFTFARTGAFTWGRIVFRNAAQGVDLDNWDLADQVAGADDTFTYELTVTFS